MQIAVNNDKPGGCSAITDYGYIIGSFTDQKGSDLTTDCKSQVCFFKIKTPKLDGAQIP